MRKSNIKSIAHWSIMGLIFGAPLIAAFGSLIPKDYRGNDSTTAVRVNEFVVGDTYRMFFNRRERPTTQTNVYYAEVIDFSLVSSTSNASTNNGFMAFATNQNNLYYNGVSYYENNGYVDFKFASYTGDLNYMLSHCYKVVSSIDNDLGMKTYNAMLDFSNMPINSWYNSLLDVTMGRPTDYNLVSVLKLYPLFATWVVLFDIVYDVFTMIPHVCHSWISKLDKENE